MNRRRFLAVLSGLCAGITALRRVVSGTAGIGSTVPIASGMKPRGRDALGFSVGGTTTTADTGIVVTPTIVGIPNAGCVTETRSSASVLTLTAGDAWTTAN